jgi:thioredoxin-related protein
MARHLPLLLCCVLGASCSSKVDLPFVPLDLDAALARARGENKVVFLDLSASWCQPCQRLKDTTFRDTDVSAWLRAHTIPLQVDIDEHPDLAKEFHVQSVPTMVFLKVDRSVLGTITGYRDATTFLQEARRRLQGISALDDARQALDAKTGDAGAQQKYFQELLAAGRNDEAVKAADAYWRASRDEPAQFGVRLSFFLGAVQQLAKEYAPAHELLDRWQREADAGMKDTGTSTPTYAAEFCALAQSRGEPQLVLHAADELKPGMARQMLVRMGAATLLEARRYKQLVDAGACEPNDVQEEFDASRSVNLPSLDAASDAAMKKAMHATQLDRVALAFEALAGVGRKEDAMTVAKIVLGGDDDAAVRQRLAKAAERAGAVELAGRVGGGH